MRRLLLLVAGAMVAAACSSDAGPTEPEPMSIPLVTWVSELADMTTDDSEPDTVDDKVGVVTDTDDPAAFDNFLGN